MKSNLLSLPVFDFLRLLFVLFDRGGRELPIHPDYVVRAAVVPPEEHVDVVERDGELWTISTVEGEKEGGA